jgi:hypothetical protein
MWVGCSNAEHQLATIKALMGTVLRVKCRGMIDEQEGSKKISAAAEKHKMQTRTQMQASKQAMQCRAERGIWIGYEVERLEVERAAKWELNAGNQSVSQMRPPVDVQTDAHRKFGGWRMREPGAV